MRIYTVGWPRSGNVHLGHLLSGALGEHSGFANPRSRGGGRDDAKCPAVCQSHNMAWRGPPGNLFWGNRLAYRNLHDDERLIWIVRDPRDTAISAWMLGKDSRRYPPDYPLLAYLVDHFAIRNASGPPCGWAKFTEGWMQAVEEKPIVQVRHEVLLADREGELRRILRELGLPENDAHIAEVVARKARERRPAYDGTGAATQPGRPEWPYHFGPTEAQFLNGYCGETMERLRYGGEPEWLALLKRESGE
jgi:hypothetical protein